MPEGRQRLFFALWPDAAARRALARVARARLRGPGRVVAPELLHCTVLFLGSVHGNVRACMEAHAEGLTVPAFDLDLVRVGSWSRAGVLWAAPAATPPALEALAAGLRAGAAACGLEVDRRPFRAHVTLARKVSRGQRPAGIDPIPWHVDRYTLVASETRPEGPRYSVVREWPLQPDPAS